MKVERVSSEALQLVLCVLVDPMSVPFFLVQRVYVLHHGPRRCTLFYVALHHNVHVCFFGQQKRSSNHVLFPGCPASR